MHRKMCSMKGFRNLPKCLCLNVNLQHLPQKLWILVGKLAVDLSATHHHLLEGAMAAECEVKVKTLEGGDLTVKVLPTDTIEELMAMLLERKHCEDPIERKILEVKVLVDTLVVDDDQTLQSAGLLNAGSEATVIYSRNEVEGLDTSHAKGLFLQVNIPSSVTEIEEGEFDHNNRVVKVVIPESVTVIGDWAF